MVLDLILSFKGLLVRVVPFLVSNRQKYRHKLLLFQILFVTLPCRSMIFLDFVTQHKFR